MTRIKRIDADLFQFLSAIIRVIRVLLTCRPMGGKRLRAALPGLWRLRRDLDFHSVFELRAARADGDLLAGLQTFDDLDQVAQAVAQFHLALFDRLALNDENFVRAEKVGGGVVWDDQNLINLVGLYRGLDEGAGFELRAAVGDQGFDFECAILLFDRRVDARDAASEFAARKGFEAEFDFASHAHPWRHLFRHAQTRAQRVNVDDGHDRRLDFQVLADGDRAGFDMTGEWRANLRVAQPLVGQVDRHLGLLHRGAHVLDLLHRQVVIRFGGFVPGLGFVVLLARDDAGFAQALRAFVFLLGVGQIGGGLFDFGGLERVFQLAVVLAQPQSRSRLPERRLLLLNGQLELNRRNARQGLSFANTVADVNQHLFDATFGFRADGDFVIREKRADGFDHSPLLSLFDRDDLDLRLRGRCARLSILGFSRRVAHAG